MEESEGSERKTKPGCAWPPNQQEAGRVPSGRGGATAPTGLPHGQPTACTREKPQGPGPGLNAEGFKGVFTGKMREAGLGLQRRPRE